MAFSQLFAIVLFAFACVEGMFFSSSSFCSIYWVKKGGAKFRLRGLVESKDAISADEGLHVVFAVVLYTKLKY